MDKIKNINWVKTMFLVPIVLVAVISISHVVSWYSLSNPIKWAIYLSIAIEVGAMTSLIAATKKIKGGVWFMFGLVTLIQLIGNIFYSYVNIVDTSSSFISWVELTTPVFDLFTSGGVTVLEHKRWLALLEGGLLPLISLTALHFYIKYEEPKNKETQVVDKPLIPSEQMEQMESMDDEIEFVEVKEDEITEDTVENVEDEVKEVVNNNDVKDVFDNNDVDYVSLEDMLVDEPEYITLENNLVGEPKPIDLVSETKPQKKTNRRVEIKTNDGRTGYLYPKSNKKNISRI